MADLKDILDWGMPSALQSQKGEFKGKTSPVLVKPWQVNDYLKTFTSNLIKPDPAPIPVPVQKTLDELEGKAKKKDGMAGEFKVLAHGFIHYKKFGKDRKLYAILIRTLPTPLSKSGRFLPGEALAQDQELTEYLFGLNDEWKYQSDEGVVDIDSDVVIDIEVKLLEARKEDS